MSTEMRNGDLVALTEALYQAEQAKLRAITESETRIRRALARLEDNRKASLALPTSTLSPIRQIGADILWQGWIGRNRAELNRELALCLVQKARILSGLRRVHGRHIAANSLLLKEKAVLRISKDRQEVAQNQSLNILRYGDPPS